MTTVSSNKPNGNDIILMTMAATLIIVIMFLMTGCSPKYTEREARVLFGCRPDSTHHDSTTTHTTDTFVKHIFIPGDTILVNGPCEEIVNMKPGEQKTVKGKRTTETYGKDSTGKTFFKCEADTYRDSMYWYKEQWKTTVTNTVFQSSPHQDSNEYAWWQIGPWFIGLLAIAGGAIFVIVRARHL